MAQSDPRPHTRTGRTASCAHCSAEFWLHKSAEARGRKYCSLPCSTAARQLATRDDEKRLKRCALCTEWKSFELFAKSTSKRSGGFQAYCSPCSGIKAAQWAAANPGRKEIHRETRREKIGAQPRKPRPDLPKEARARRNAQSREWRKKNKSKVLMWNRLRRHRERAAGPMPKAWEINRLGCMQDWRCIYCTTLLSDAFHIDHRTPISRGGSNSLSNLQLLCPPCNLKKATKTEEEFGLPRHLPEPVTLPFNVDEFAEAVARRDYASALSMLGR